MVHPLIWWRACSSASSLILILFFPQPESSSFTSHLHSLSPIIVMKVSRMHTTTSDRFTSLLESSQLQTSYRWWKKIDGVIEWERHQPIYWMLLVIEFSFLWHNAIFSYFQFVHSFVSVRCSWSNMNVAGEKTTVPMPWRQCKVKHSTFTVLSEMNGKNEKNHQT